MFEYPVAQNLDHRLLKDVTLQLLLVFILPVWELSMYFTEPVISVYNHGSC